MLTIIIGLAFVFLCAYGLAVATTPVSPEEAKRRRLCNETPAQRDERRLNEWLAKVVDRNLERKIKDALYNRDEELIKEVKESWHIYFEEDAPDRFNNTPERGRYGDIDIETASPYGEIDFYTAFRILMANRGKLPELDAIYGIKFSASGPIHEEEIRRMDRYEQFFRGINTGLVKANKDYYHYYCRPDAGCFKWKVLFGDDRYYGGVVKWKPAIPVSELQNSGIAIY